MGLVLWIDKNEFSTGLIEKVFKKKGLPFYGLNNVQDFDYLVEDLKPQVIVLDALTAVEGLEDFKRQYEKFTSIPFILLGSSGELDFIAHKLGELKKPLDPFKISGQIQHLLGELS